VVGVAAGPGVAHLQKLARHVHADEVVRFFVAEEYLVDLRRRLAGYLFRAKAPVRQNLGLVRLDRENTLLPLADAVEVGLLAKFVFSKSSE
jgi:hypothetical protein